MYTLSKCNQPKDITKWNDNILQIKNIIVSYFISSFDTDLRYAPNLFNIVSGTAPPEIVQDWLLSVKDAGKKLKESFEKRITGNSNVEFFSPIKKYPLKIFESCSQKITVRKGDKEKQIVADRDIFGMLMSTSYKTKAAVNLEALLVYPLANHPPALCVPGGAPRKFVKSKVYDAALNDLYLTDGKQLPGKETLHTYFLDV